MLLLRLMRLLLIFAEAKHLNLFHLYVFIFREAEKKIEIE